MCGVSEQAQSSKTIHLIIVNRISVALVPPVYLYRVCCAAITEGSLDRSLPRTTHNNILFCILHYGLLIYYIIFILQT